MTRSSNIGVRQTPETQLDPRRSDVELVETHISSLLLDRDVVHKRKRAVRYPFIDLSTPARREAACRKEIEINRRFSPDVYLGLEEIVDSTGAVVDHAVLMRRMPEERRLATLVRNGADVSRCLRSVARIIAVSHACAPRSEAIDAAATPPALLDLWQRSLEEMRHFAPAPLDRSSLDDIGVLAARYVHGRTELLSDRISRRQIVDGHGDLLADDIFCLDDGPRLLDALEFDDRLRWGDVIADVAFLAMDLERLGRSDLAAQLLGWYREYSGETHPESLAHHYIAYRALVRSKVACLRGGAEREAVAFLEQSRHHLVAGRIRLVLIGGLPGTGKSTLAEGLAKALSWPLLRSDEIRKELAGRDPLERATAEYAEGIYSPVSSAATYQTMLSRAQHLLGHGENVIVDATFSRRAWREAAATLAQRSSSELTELVCQVPADVAALRLVHREVSDVDPSDATPAIAARMAAQFDEWPTAITVSTLRPADQLVQSLVERLRAPFQADQASSGGS